jgi:hypothetical protein
MGEQPNALKAAAAEAEEMPPVPWWVRYPIGIGLIVYLANADPRSWVVVAFCCILAACCMYEMLLALMVAAIAAAFFGVVGAALGGTGAAVLIGAWMIAESNKTKNR